MDGVFPIHVGLLWKEKPIDCQPRGLRESLITHANSYEGGLAGNCSINTKSSDVLMIEVGDDGWTILVK